MNNGNEHFELRLFCILCEAWNNEYSSYIVTWLQWHLFIILGRLLSFFRRSSKGSSSELVNDDFCALISTNETAPEKNNGLHSFRAAAFWGWVECSPAANLTKHRGLCSWQPSLHCRPSGQDAHCCFSREHISGEDAHRPLLPDAGSPPPLLQGDPTGRRRQELPCGRGEGGDRGRSGKHRVEGLRLLHRIIKGGTVVCWNLFYIVLYSNFLGTALVQNILLTAGHTTSLTSL